LLALAALGAPAAAPAEPPSAAHLAPAQAGATPAQPPAVTTPAQAPATAPSVRVRASLPDIEREVMCPVCGVPLNLADSPQADRERAFIRALIARGRTSGQIKQELVAQFGRSVLALPPSRGFDLAVYLVPIGAGALLLALVALLLARWRRRGRALAPAAPSLGADDARRVERDLARYDL
jgi:cytochrome c-type biogenesis protein CcmH/NrfF